MHFYNRPFDNRKIAFIAFIIFFCNTLYAQNGYYRYWVELKDKDSTFSIERPREFLSQKAIDRRTKYKIPVNETDFPVNGKYIKAIASKGFRIIHTSRWLNTVTIQSTNKNLADSLKQFPFIFSVKSLGLLKFPDDEDRTGEPVDINEALSVLESKFDDGKNKNTDTNFYGKSFTQINMVNVQKLHQMGFMGQGITVAVVDAGFKNANKLQVFRYAFDSSHVKGTRDFVENNRNVFNDDDHGNGVWSCMAAYQPNQLVGTSPKADYWLLRSEYAPTESPIEESHWLAAAEFADSVGVDVISSSLGYNIFDDDKLSHTYKELDGKTTIISRAATMAAAKGILVLNSAGNEGDNAWRYISAPADALNIITIGSIDENNSYASFSSIGPSADKRIKPDVVALGEKVWVPSISGTIYQTNGTSYSCPIITGVAACLMQANPKRTNAEIISALKISASQYYAPDKYLGYGIPDAVLANKILGGDNEFPLKKDIVLDARFLNNNKLHLTFFLRSQQKINVVIEDTKDLLAKPIFKGTIDCRNSGVNRIEFSKIKNLPKGIFAVYMYSKDGVSSFVFINK